ncbi:MAG: MarR family winged helix-turn-helix transcriptional regulator [Paracoccaceae bacterium]|nr:MarR family winged helix-turn-helix transcriptional regulator [Paracoccaceae bacterium]
MTGETVTTEFETAQTPLTVSRTELLEDGKDARFRALVHGLLAFSSRLEDVRQSFGSLVGLSGIQYTILISILHLQGSRGIGVKAIAEHLSLSGAFVTIETGKLVKLDLVRKCVNPKDRRRVLLEVTSKGRSLLNDLAPVQREVNDVLFETLSAEEFHLLGKIIGDLVGSSEKALALADYITGTERAAK